MVCLATVGSLPLSADNTTIDISITRTAHTFCAESDQVSNRRTDLVIDGKKAQLEFVVVPEEDLLVKTELRHTVTLCVPDVGDHKNKFEIYAANLDVDFLNGFKRSLEHIRLR
jgi:hypothetical protein